jgi:hypothetical protein
VVARQATCGNGMGRQDRQHVEADLSQDLVKPVEREPQPAERTLDRDFPRRDSTDQDRVVG